LIGYDAAKEAWLREILSDDLQELEDGFLDDLSETIKRVSAEAAGSQDLRRSLLAAQKDRLEGFLRDIIETRLLKIVKAASMEKVPEGLSPEEKQVLGAVEELCRAHKERFYRFQEELPGEAFPTESSAQVPETSQEPEAGKTERISTVPERPQVPTGERNQILRIRMEFPSFVGPDLKAYGPFAKEDLVALPDEISQILVSRKIGERISPAGEES